ncbi:MAG: NUDIX domain-containing protein [Candidatus Gracilibacteria bacterium]|nr:NUDIX domain-containing protein [Candidatus Gracilibacteria bacterium]
MNNISVIIYDISQEDKLVGFTNIVCLYQGKWLLVRGKGKTTWELPGGHIENGETSLNSAKRELYEETGINGVDLEFLCSRKLEMLEKGITYYGNVYIVNVLLLGELPDSEIEEISLFEEIPENLTYPFIQIDILNKAKEFFKIR